MLLIEVTIIQYQYTEVLYYFKSKAQENPGHCIVRTNRRLVFS
jgi:hypothetical protein